MSHVWTAGHLRMEVTAQEFVIRTFIKISAKQHASLTPEKAMQIKTMANSPIVSRYNVRCVRVNLDRPYTKGYSGTIVLEVRLTELNQINSASAEMRKTRAKYYEKVRDLIGVYRRD